MKGRIAVGFALKNLKANRYLELPFLLASGTMLTLFYIMVSLLKNDYVNTRHRSLPMMIALGVVIAGIFSFGFVIYANRFLIRRRHKEFALYGVLGLEKRHIRNILLVEQLIRFGFLLLFTNVGGFITGKFVFLGLNRLLRDVTGSLMDYPFSFETGFISSLYVIFLFLFIYLMNVFSIRNTSPIELLNRNKKGEGEPKNRFVFLGIGLVLLTSGYGLALTIEGVLKSMGFFFLAVILVMMATYLLFISFSIFVLKLQRKNKRFYYQAKHFLTVSGLIYRMKSNALGLASLSILSTGVIITLASTLAIYGNIEANVTRTLTRDYEIENFKDFTINEVPEAKKELRSLVNEKMGSDATDFYTKVYFTSPINKEGNELKALTDGDMFRADTLYAVFTTLSSYNEQYKKKVVLEKDEILISANNRTLLKEDRLILGGKEYKGTMIENIVPANMALETYLIVVSDEEVLEKIGKIYKTLDMKGNSINEFQVAVSIGFNTGGKDFFLSAKERSKLIKRYVVTSRKEFREFTYELNGGFLFLGLIVGLIFLSGTILITYYKQVSEGIEDRKNYMIMEKVGLPDSLIKKTANAQIIWTFFLPLAVALIHSLVASKIVFQLLGLFGIHDFMVYGEKLALVSLVFALVYYINFKITSNIYYRQVK